MLRYLIHAIAIALVGVVLSMAPASAGACSYGSSVRTDLPRAAVELRASSGYAMQSHEHKHGDRGAPCGHGDCILCCPVCSFASASIALIFPQPLGAMDFGNLVFGAPPEATSPDIRLTLLPFRPPRALG